MQIFVELWIIKGYIVFLRFNWLVVCSVRYRPCSKLLELHDITSKCSCLIRKDILNLPKLFIEIGSLGVRRHVLVLVVHQGFISHKHCLPILNKF
jgi:hypothetical protein